MAGATRLMVKGATFAVAAVMFSANVQAQARPELRWSPERPVEGTMMRLELHGVEQTASVEAELAGERLHFQPHGDGLAALAGVPIEAPARYPVRLVVRHASGVDTVNADIPVARGQFRHERLTVAPGFGRAPDSATAARMAREAARAAEVSRRSHGTRPMWTEGWTLPRDSRITSGFGHGREFNGRVTSRHMGVDLAGAVGTPVRAANRGVVALVDTFHLGGIVTYLDHGAGVVTAYLHLSRVDVAQGDTVERGEVIGRVGATGRVTGPHLHWIARYGRVTVDPLSLVALTKE